jgi:hypothetical protein
MINTNTETMTTYQTVLNSKNQQGTIIMGNDSAKWYAISREGMHIITFYQGGFNFTEKKDVNKYYKNQKSFAKRVSQLLNRGY